MKYRDYQERRQALSKHGYREELIRLVETMDVGESDFYTRLLIRAPKNIVDKINADVSVLKGVMGGE